MRRTLTFMRGVLNMNYEEMIKYARQKDAVNPHKVNPFYVKKIEVEK